MPGMITFEDLGSTLVSVVTPIEIGLTWEPNAPDAVLVSGDNSIAVLALNANVDDPSREAVVFTWAGCQGARLEPWNDEGILDHPLWGDGLKDVHWIGELASSYWLDEHPGSAGRDNGLRHFVLPLKECVIEVLADSFSISRRPGPTYEAAFGVVREHAEAWQRKLREDRRRLAVALRRKAHPG